MVSDASSFSSLFYMTLPDRGRIMPLLEALPNDAAGPVTDTVGFSSLFYMTLPDRGRILALHEALPI